MKLVTHAVLAAALAASLATPAGAEDRYRDYDSRKAGHPLRVIAYAAHPVGVILDRLIFRPAWYIGSFEPIRTLVGREPVLSEEVPADDKPESSPQPSGS